MGKAVLALSPDVRSSTRMESLQGLYVGPLDFYSELLWTFFPIVIYAFIHPFILAV